MAKQWAGRCSACNKDITYADALALRDIALGRPRQLMCPNCERLERRGLKPVSVPNTLLPGVPQSSTAPLGRLREAERTHLLREQITNFDTNIFAVRAEEIGALYTELLRDDTPVVIAVAPTGSGKSTFLPYRLFNPQTLDADTFTRGRQIVITQPRKKAATAIPAFVAESLHGANCGIGHEIGYRVKGVHACDWRNRLTYVTDGTLINWLIRGELDRISLIIIDEAHERSLNIDVILGLVTRALPQFPHLKLLIVSATIDHVHFQRHFERRLPKGLRCGIVICSGTKPMGLGVHYRRDEIVPLPYAPGALRELSRGVAEKLAHAILRLLLAMEGPRELTDPHIESGDILGFLHGKREIEDACGHIVKYLSDRHPALSERTDVYPYHAEVSTDIARKATDKKIDPSRRRIVIASNAAETSLTIEGLVHVVDSGFIKQTQWDPALEQAPLLPVVHSQPGCRQRWGRVGRVAPGEAWCLYSKPQFRSVFPATTVPEIQRSCLDAVVLKAKRGGAEHVEEKAFPWLDAPAADEIERTLARLQRQRLLDADGDLTKTGIIAAMASEQDTLYNRLIADGDRFGFGIEVSTLVPFLELGLKNLLPYEKDWSDDIKRGVREAQRRVRATCSDDLELCLRIYSEWQNATLPPSAEWTIPRLERQEISHCNLPPPRLVEKLRSARDQETIVGLIQTHITESAIAKQYSERAVASFLRAARSMWPRMHGVDSDVLAAVKKRRDGIIDEIGAKKKGMEDRSIDFAGLGRLRAIVARAFLDQVHVRDKGDGVSASVTGRYTLLFPSDDPAPVEIATVSNCAANPPDAFVSLGPKEVLPGKGDRQRLRLVPFVVRVEPELIEAVRDRDELEMAEYFRRAMPRPAQGSTEDARLRQHERLRRDYPVGTIIECRVLGEMHGIADVEVVRAVGWGGGPPLTFASSETWQEWREYERGRSFDAGEAALAKPVGVPAQVLSEEDELDLISEEWQAAPNERQERVQDERPLVAVTGRLQWFGIPPDAQTVRAEVTRHSDITGEPSLILVAPPLRERFSRFAERTAVGDDIDVEVIGPSSRGSLERGLQIRDLRTGFEVVLPLEEVFLLREECLLEDVEPGTRLRVRVEFVDHRSQTVYATALNALEPELARLHAALRKEATNGILRKIDDDNTNVYLLAMVDDLKRGPLRVPIKSKVPRQQFDGPSGFSIPYTTGRRITLKTRADASSSVKFSAHLMESEKSGLIRAGIEITGASLSCQGRLTFDARTAAVKVARTVELMAAVRALYGKSNWVFADIVAPDLVGKTVEGRVQSFKFHRVEAVLTGGIIGVLDPAEATWFTERPRLDHLFQAGQIIRAVVLRIDDWGNAVLSTKRARISHNPWERNGIATLYPVGTTIVGKFGAKPIVDRTWVDIEPGLQGSVHVSDLRTLAGGAFINDARKVATPGRWVKVSVRGHNTVKKQLEVTVLGWATAPAAEVIIPPLQTAPASPASASEQQVSWLDGEWPWDVGENAIPKDVAPPKVRSPQRARARLPLDQRSKPSGWRILLT